MHSEPSKAAMERAQSMSGYMNASASFIPVAAVARYIDTVDRVARDAETLIGDWGKAGPVVAGLRTIMLPDEPDAKLELRMALSKHLSAHDDIIAAVDDQLTALAAAGYTITKEPTV